MQDGFAELVLGIDFIWSTSFAEIPNFETSFF